MVFVGLAAIPLGVLLIWWGRLQLRKRRREQLRRQPAPARVLEVLQQNVGLYSWLPDDLRTELHGLINVFLAEKQFVGCDGLVVSDEMEITIAALACILLLNRPTTFFPGFSTILVYPDAYIATEVSYDGQVEIQRETTRAGESWHRGPVILSWADVQRGASHVGDGYNVVLHEFAHKLDEENGGNNGLPVLSEQGHYADWATVLGREFRSLEKRVASRSNRVIDEYGLTSPPEFFAVATESFFEKPVAMKSQLPELYQQLSTFYRLDPADWFRN